MKAAQADEAGAEAGSTGEAEEQVPAEVDAQLLKQMEDMVGAPQRPGGAGHVGGASRLGCLLPARQGHGHSGRLRLVCTCCQHCLSTAQGEQATAPCLPCLSLPRRRTHGPAPRRVSLPTGRRAPCTTAAAAWRQRWAGGLLRFLSQRLRALLLGDGACVPALPVHAMQLVVTALEGCQSQCHPGACRLEEHAEDADIDEPLMVPKARGHGQGRQAGMHLLIASPLRSCMRRWIRRLSSVQTPRPTHYLPACLPTASGCLQHLRRGRPAERTQEEAEPRGGQGRSSRAHPQVGWEARQGRRAAGGSRGTGNQQAVADLQHACLPAACCRQLPEAYCVYLRTSAALPAGRGSGASARRGRRSGCGSRSASGEGVVLPACACAKGSSAFGHERGRGRHKHPRCLSAAGSAGMMVPRLPAHHARAGKELALAARQEEELRLKRMVEARQREKEEEARAREKIRLKLGERRPLGRDARKRSRLLHHTRASRQHDLLVSRRPLPV